MDNSTKELLSQLEKTHDNLIQSRENVNIVEEQLKIAKQRKIHTKEEISLLERKDKISVPSAVYQEVIENMYSKITKINESLDKLKISFETTLEVMS